MVTAKCILAHNHQNAIQVYNRVLIYKPHDIDLHKKIVQLYDWKNLPKKALYHFEQIAKYDSINIKHLKELANRYF